MSLCVALFPQENDKEGKEGNASDGRKQGNSNQGRIVRVGLFAALSIIRIL